MGSSPLTIVNWIIMSPSRLQQKKQGEVYLH